ncbi:MAG: hypothetical protein ABR879_05135 [Methanomassiliicoccales archaeon]|jgi:hypothetical protein
MHAKLDNEEAMNKQEERDEKERPKEESDIGHSSWLRASALLILVGIALSVISLVLGIVTSLILWGVLSWSGQWYTTTNLIQAFVGYGGTLFVIGIVLFLFAQKGPLPRATTGQRRLLVLGVILFAAGEIAYLSYAAAYDTSLMNGAYTADLMTTLARIGATGALVVSIGAIMLSVTGALFVLRARKSDVHDDNSFPSVPR